MITVETNVRLPAKGPGCLYPWEAMKVGESFLFPAGTQFPAETARAYSRRHPAKQFTTRKTREGYRCWRIA